jgi:hypothetical protein
LYDEFQCFLYTYFNIMILHSFQNISNNIFHTQWNILIVSFWNPRQNLKNRDIVTLIKYLCNSQCNHWFTRVDLTFNSSLTSLIICIGKDNFLNLTHSNVYLSGFFSWYSKLNHWKTLVKNTKKINFKLKTIFLYSNIVIFLNWISLTRP